MGAPLLSGSMLLRGLDAASVCEPARARPMKAHLSNASEPFVGGGLSHTAPMGRFSLRVHRFGALKGNQWQEEIHHLSGSPGKERHPGMVLRLTKP